MAELMDLKVDYAFKQLFGTKGNERILITFLNVVLGLSGEDQITSLTIENPEFSPEYLRDKKSVLDIFARTEKNVQINIEIQMVNKHDMKERTLYYWSRMFKDQLEEGQSYTKLSKTITINILNFRLIRETSKFHSSFHLYEDQDFFCLSDLMEIHFVEIPKLLVKWRNRDLNPWQDLLARWLLLLGSVDKRKVHDDILNELENIAEEGDEIMKETLTKWENLSKDREARRAYESRLKAVMDEATAEAEAEKRKQQAHEEGLEEGREVGRKEGRREGKREGKEEGKKEGKMEGKKVGAQEQSISVAKKLLGMGMAIQDVAKATDLSEEEIEQIQQS